MKFSNSINFQKFEQIEGIFSEKDKSNKIKLKTAYIPETSSFTNEVYNPVENSVEKENVSYSTGEFKDPELEQTSKIINESIDLLDANKAKKVLEGVVERLTEIVKENDLGA